MRPSTLLGVLGLGAPAASACVHATTTHTSGSVFATATATATATTAAPHGRASSATPPRTPLAGAARRTYLNWHLGPLQQNGPDVALRQAALVVHGAHDERIEIGPVPANCHVPALPAAATVEGAQLALVCQWDQYRASVAVVPRGQDRFRVLLLGRTEHSAALGEFVADRGTRFFTQILSGGRSWALTGPAP